jgi:hypothetical protein
VLKIPVVERQQEVERRSQKPAIMQVMYSEDKPFVYSQQFLFDNLCNNAIHAREKMRQIGRAATGDFTNTIIKPSEIQKLL